MTLNLLGKQFGDWVVLYRDFKFEEDLKQKKGYSRSCWRCKCTNCNTERTVRGNDLKNGKSTNCGCRKRQNIYNKIKLYPGEKYGKLTVIEEDFEKEQTSVLQKSYWKCQCECGSYTTVIGSDLKNGHTLSCGCIKSKGEELIAKSLTNLQILFEREKTFTSCSSSYNNTPYRFDFYLPDYNILIEYDGKQHFSSKNCGWGEGLKEIQNRDSFKTNWCINNNIPLIRIPYTEFDKINDKYVLNKIKEVQI